jgi:hypothetical protein
MIKGRTVLLAASLLLNLLCAIFVIYALSGKTSSLAFYSLDRDGVPSLAAAAVASVPLESGSVSFGAVEITLKRGGSAALQFSGMVSGRQVNWLVTALYDHSLIAVRQNGFGITVEALNAGETVMQALMEDGFRDIAVIRIVE